MHCRAELRAGILEGTFTYGQDAVVNGQLETVARGGLRPPADRPIKLLANHDFGKALASNENPAAFTVDFGADAVTFRSDVNLWPDSSWARDTKAMLDAGLMTGLSPGFFAARNGMRRSGDKVVVSDAVLAELSLVEMPAYAGAGVHLRWLGELPQEQGGLPQPSLLDAASEPRSCSPNRHIWVYL